MESGVPTWDTGQSLFINWDKTLKIHLNVSDASGKCGETLWSDEEVGDKSSSDKIL